MKKLILRLAAVAALGAALPASAQVVIRENHRGNVVVRPAAADYGHRYGHRHHRVRYAYFDRHHHRHWGWR